MLYADHCRRTLLAEACLSEPGFGREQSLSGATDSTRRALPVFGKVQGALRVNLLDHVVVDHGRHASGAAILNANANAVLNIDRVVGEDDVQQV